MVWTHPTDAIIALLRAHGQHDLNGLAVLAAIFVVTGLVPIPRTALCIASGAIFGLVAIPVILPSTTLGGAIGYLLARYLFAARLHRILDARPKSRAIMAAIDSEGWRLVGLMRFAGAMPTFSQNYLFGLTRISFQVFVLASFFFSIPQICLYVYLGSLGRAAMLSETGSPLSLALALPAALCLLAVIIVVSRKARATLRQMEGAMDVSRNLDAADGT
ncbi:MAG TPA: VTT domain-containing protein [Terriglobales bacterium]|nr:VTT domain-containing protein [Terriglobales bacterium]